MNFIGILTNIKFISTTGILLENLAPSSRLQHGASTLAQGHLLLGLGDQSQRVSITKVPPGLPTIGRLPHKVRAWSSRRSKVHAGRWGARGRLSMPQSAASIQECTLIDAGRYAAQELGIHVDRCVELVRYGGPLHPILLSHRRVRGERSHQRAKLIASVNYWHCQYVRANCDRCRCRFAAGGHFAFQQYLSCRVHDLSCLNAVSFLLKLLIKRWIAWI